jgi:hypothetical protein
VKAAPIASSPIALEGTVDLAEILRRRCEQVEIHGHDDSDRPPALLAEKAIRMAMDARDLMHAGDRQNLPVAYARCAKAAALILATMNRLRQEIQT